jgi:hypothetical protein
MCSLPTSFEHRPIDAGVQPGVFARAIPWNGFDDFVAFEKTAEAVLNVASCFHTRLKPVVNESSGKNWHTR